MCLRKLRKQNPPRARISPLTDARCWRRETSPKRRLNATSTHDGLSRMELCYICLRGCVMLTVSASGLKVREGRRQIAKCLFTRTIGGCGQSF